MTTLQSIVVSGSLLLSLAAAVSPQDAVSDVIPGRDFEDHKMLTPGLTDVWKLHVEKDEMLWCQVDSSAFDPVLDLVDANGTLLGSDDGAGTRSELWLRMPAAGDVQFRVRPFQGSGGGFYHYRLHRFGTEPLGTSAEAAHQFGVEQWWHYRVALTAGDVLVPTVLGEARLTGVFDAMRNATGEALGGYRAPHTGDYFVRVEGGKDRRGQTLTQLARIGELTRGTARDEQTAPYGLDHWRFPVHAGEAFVLDLRMPDAQLALDLVLVDVAPRSDGPAFVMAGHFDKGGQVRRYYLARRDATLELRVRNTSPSTAAYRVAIAQPERELAVGQRTPGRIEIGDGSLYRLPLVSGQLLRVSLESTAFDGKLDLWDVQGNVFAHLDDRSPLDRNPSQTFLVPATGTYRVLAFSAGAGVAAGDFTLQVESLEVPLLRPGTPVAVRIEAGAPCYLHLDLQAGQEVWLSVRSQAFDAFLTVLDPAGNDSFRCEGGGIGRDVLVAYRASHSGRHTLLVPGGRGNGDGEVKAVLQ